MRVKTNAGEVELTAEMVCKGMVFRDPADPEVIIFSDNPRLYNDGTEGVCEVQEALAADVQKGSIAFLGCDPTIASRADCERFGVHGDAAAYGFARLREGGAVDLTNPERFCRGMVFEIVGAVHGERCGARFTLMRRNMGDGNNGAEWECHGDGAGDWKMWRAVRGGEVRFIGLSADIARFEDVERLCCGAQPSYEDLAPCDGCTLAIGPHEHHEDLATGARWPAMHIGVDYAERASVACHGTLADMDRIWAKTPAPAWPATGSRAWVVKTVREMGYCVLKIEDVPTDGIPTVMVFVDAPDSALSKLYLAIENGMGPVALRVSNASLTYNERGPVAPKPAINWRYGQASLGLTNGHVLRDGGITRWQVAYLGLRIAHGKAYGPKAAEYVQRLAGEWMRRIHDASPGIEWLARFFGLLFKVWDEDPAQVRAKREAPLVALVNACPEGLNPVGWRAAVLALHEPRSGVEGVAFFHRDEIGERINIERQLRDDEVFTLAGEIAVPAYRRAIVPRAKVAPERKQRGPAIVVDDGRDE